MKKLFLLSLIVGGFACQSAEVEGVANRAQQAVVGDGVIDGVEECDDGDTDDGDGCDSAGQIEPGFTCDGLEPTTCVPGPFEFCTNGVDDDGDGLVDVWDLDCPCTEGGPINACPATCTYTPTAQPYDPQLVWSAQLVDARETPLVGDIDNDGVPEVVVDDYRNPGKIYIINGQTGVTEHVISTFLNLAQNNSANAIADTDGDGFAEIYFVDAGAKLSRIIFDGTTWTLDYTSTDSVDNRLFIPGFADFDGDGTPEVFLGNNIFRASDGTKLLDAPTADADPGAAVAIDILPDSACATCSGLELVNSQRVWAVDLAGNTITQEVRLTGVGNNRGPTSVADMDNDGDLDVVYTANIGGKSNLVVWDGQTNTLLMPTFETPPGLTNTTSGAAGRPTIADFDNDGLNEIGYAGKEIYVMIDDVLDAAAPKLVWSILNTDRSARTGSTVFDFEADGQAEIVYRDETDLFVLRGSDGAELFKTACRSGTRFEYPVIADVNADGETEIIVTCNNPNGGVKAFKSANAPWAPSRSVWNQHAYNVTNVNDDLTIPPTPAPNTIVFGGSFDNYLTQAAVVDSGGGAQFPVPDAEFTAFSSEFTACPDQVTVTYTLSNDGDSEIPAGFFVSFYDADPVTTAATLVGTGQTGANIAPGSTGTFSASISATGPLTIFAVANDPGTQTTPFDPAAVFPITSTGECDLTNNVDSFAITLCPECGNGVVEPIINEVCDDGNATDNDGCDDGAINSCQFSDGVACTSSAQCTGVCDASSGVCEPALICGNGTIEAGEGCDDGNTLGGDLCDPLCKCGDGVIDDGQGCDDGNNVSGDGCSAVCLIEDDETCSDVEGECESGFCDPIENKCEQPNTCGNGVLDAGEGCDDGANVAGDGCDAACLVENDTTCPADAAGLTGDAGCASGLCDPTSNNCEPALTCGNGVLEAGEGCDDGANANGDGCNALCKLENNQFCNDDAPGDTGNASCESGLCDPFDNKCEEPLTCGNGILEVGEGCDDGRNEAGDGCDAACKLENGETCNADADGAIGDAGCASGLCDPIQNTCEVIGSCGNGVLDAGEGCDDGANAAGDGCDAACKLENDQSCNTTAPGATGDASCASGLCDPVEDTCEDIGSCGNGILDAGEGCDDGANVAGDGCNVNCLLEDNATCNATAPGETGDDSCASGVCDANSNQCEPALSCGNGLVEAGEGCDDGANTAGDGCDAECKVENGTSCNTDANGATGAAGCASGVCDPTSLECEEANVCGNGILDADEGCDDGNTEAGDGCNASCLIENNSACQDGPGADASCASGLCDPIEGTCEPTLSCGNGVLEAGEGCDDGANAAGDGCSATCLVENNATCNTNTAGAIGSAGCASGLCDPTSSQCEDANVCGNGVIENAEGCDDGGVANNDGCNSACLIEDESACVDSVTCASGLCDPIQNTCEPPLSCGNGVLDAGEGCDDGANDPGDGCDATCLIENGNTCDAANASACQSGLCDPVQSTCEPALSCGNGVLEAGEGCDDGANVAGDGCNAGCLVENGTPCNANADGETGDAGCQSGLCDPVQDTCEPSGACGNGVLEAGEGCDDGNPNAGDGCSDVCLVEEGGACNADANGAVSDAGCASGLCDPIEDTCEAPLSCGNGVLDAGEGCDDGANVAGDGCDSDCKVENGTACNTDINGALADAGCASGLCDPVQDLCEPALSCGNGVLEAGEGCDDGANAAGDGCDANCLVENNSACNVDGAGAVSSAGCASGVCDPVQDLCEPALTCGNGVLEPGEACDDGAALPGDGCDAACLVENNATCNSNIVGVTGDAGCASGLCDPVQDLCEPALSCGNGVLEAGEGCDDGENVPGDGCDANCLVENNATCNINAAGALADAGCASGLCDPVQDVCEPALSCGNGVLEAGEGCDDGANAAGDGCDANCLVENNAPCNIDTNGAVSDAGCASGLCDPIQNACEPTLSCGNGVLETGEGCDDGNVSDGDGCNATCFVENGTTCNADAAGNVGDIGCASGLCDPVDDACEPALTCGNGVLEAGEGCDDGNTDADDGCSASCLLEDDSACNTNANGAVSDAGCASALCDPIENTCEPALSCGNGVLDPGEGCDDGNINTADGCNADCFVEDGTACNENGGGCASGVCDPTVDVCEPANICGNGVLESGEGCDDGEALGGDGCDENCLVENDASCNSDAGGALAGAGCASGFCNPLSDICDIPVGCGNGALDASEGCDDANNTAGDGCDENCLVENGSTCNSDAAGALAGDGCASGFCDPDNDACRNAPACGDGIVDDNEGCDDNNLTAGDGCDLNCLVEEGSACNGATPGLVDGDGCATGFCDPIEDLCEPALTCGNGVLEAGEGCDDGNEEAGDGCDENCLVEEGNICPVDAAGVTGALGCASGVCDPTVSICEPADVCGNGVIETGEGCDDGGTDTGDGCDENCLIENDATCADNTQCASGFCNSDGACAIPTLCGDGNLEFDEGCDDGNNASNDGCSPDCLVEDGSTCNADALGLVGNEGCEGGFCDSDTNTCVSETCVQLDVGTALDVESGEVIALGAEDANWTYSSALGDAGVAALHSGPCVGQWERDFATAGWISKTTGCDPFVASERTFFKRSFTITDTTTVLNLDLYADNFVREVYVNGAPQGIDSFPVNLFRVPESVSLSGFVAGVNTIEIEVEQSGGQPGGLMVLAQAVEDCRSPACGDGNTDGNEGCDDGNLVSGDGCSITCFVEAGEPCGDEGITGEAACVSGVCGAGNVCEGVCGDGVVEADEGCDDGNSDDGDGCDSSCLVEEGGACGSVGLQGDDACALGVCNEAVNSCGPGCGDGDVGADEGCDDGNLIGGDGCDLNCLIESGVPCGDEGLLSNDSCKSGVCNALELCAIDLCGDGVIDADDGEECDDGNLLDFDGCNAFCVIEPEFVCQEVALNTKFDGAIVDDDIADPSWTYSASLGGVQVPAETTAECHGIWARELPEAGWVTKPGGCESFGSQEYAYFTRTFTVSNASQASITFDVYADNHVREVYLNGIAQGFDAGSVNLFRVPPFTVNLSAGFSPGPNTLTIAVQQSGGSPGAMMVDASGYSNCIVSTCGNGVVDELEGCDDGNFESGDGCASNCLVESGEPCGSTGVSGDLACLNGNCNLEAGLCEAQCGDAIVDEAEGCDDGNSDDGDGCSASCLVEDGGQCGSELLLGADACESGLCNEGANTCGEGCGDGVVNGDEGCDDGNLVAGDGCSPNCFAEAGEVCDTDSDCATRICDGGTCIESLCGNGVVDPGEGCDDDNVTDDDGDGCSSLCLVEVGEACGSTALTGDAACASGVCHPDDNICVFPFCGNGIVDFNEACDDGNRREGDGCDAACIVEVGRPCGSTEISGDDACVTGFCNDEGLCAEPRVPECGDGIVDEDLGEGCDDGNLDNDDGCDATCLVEEGSACVDDDDCQSALCDEGLCVAAICGDGSRDGNEECDDGNIDNGDGCDENCALETVCGDGIIEGGEACDDGNSDAGDGCSAICLLEDGQVCQEDESCESGTCDDGLCGQRDIGGDDFDRDGIVDGEDNCPEVFNPQQRDGDGDGIGDLCDGEGGVGVAGGGLFGGCSSQSVQNATSNVALWGFVLTLLVIGRRRRRG